MYSATQTQAVQLVQPTFIDVAKNIISKAFRSAICIDDQYASAYSEPEGLNSSDPKSLYYSFREQWSCDLDIHNFKTIADSWKGHMLENKELMILDWELDPGQKFESTIEILNQVIQSKKIPFVVIYTNTEDLNSVSQNLFERLNPISQEQYDKFFKGMESLKHICDDEYDLETLKETGREIFFSYINSYSQRVNLKSEIAELFLKQIPVKKEHRDKLLNKVTSQVKSVFGLKSEDPFLYLSFIFLRALNTSCSHSFARIETADNAYLLNNAVTILLFHKREKGGVEPSYLFDAFSKALINNPHNFLSLLSLEFKDKIKENFNKIGSKFSALDEQAFFYHMGNYRKDNGSFKIEEIYDFILKGWISELYQLKVAETSDVLNYLSNRYQELDIDKLKGEGELLGNLLRYSAYISTINLNSDKHKKIWFGDIFKNLDNEYFLCITPHCDCVLPTEKIKNNFYFVRGVVNKNVESSLANAEKEFTSFIIVDGVPQCIDWKCKPFTSYIKQPFIDCTELTYSGKTSILTYVVSLKENYAQRISNESFSYGYRVGIDLPHISVLGSGLACPTA